MVAATNRNLREEVLRGSFREDLYYRFAVVQVHLPTLKDRPDDIPLLVDHFLRESARGREPMNVSYATMERLKRHEWPGNVRELRNFIERAAVLSSSGQVEERFLEVGEMPRRGSSFHDATLIVDTGMPFKDAKTLIVEEFERTYWRKLLDRHQGKLAPAARAAGVHRKSLEYILRKLDLMRDLHDEAE